jgi:hypothetical protein
MDPAQGFGAINGLRLTNLTGETLLIDNVSSTGQGEEFLFPNMQMVYHTRNISARPRAQGYYTRNSFPPTQLLVEWSDDSINDFIGSYPTFIQASGINSNSQPLALNIQGAPTVATATFANYSANATNNNIPGVGPETILPGFAFQLEAMEVSATYAGANGIAQFTIGLASVVGGVLKKVYAQATFTLQKTATDTNPSAVVVVTYDPRIIIPAGDTPVFVYMSGPAGVSFSAVATGAQLPVS